MPLDNLRDRKGSRNPAEKKLIASLLIPSLLQHLINIFSLSKKKEFYIHDIEIVCKKYPEFIPHVIKLKKFRAYRDNLIEILDQAIANDPKILAEVWPELRRNHRQFPDKYSYHDIIIRHAKRNEEFAKDLLGLSKSKRTFWNKVKDFFIGHPRNTLTLKEKRILLETHRELQKHLPDSELAKLGLNESLNIKKGKQEVDAANQSYNQITKNISEKNSISPLLLLPLDLICLIMKHLRTREALTFALCLIGDNVLYDTYNRKDRELSIQQKVEFCKNLLMTAKKLKPVLSLGFCYLPTKNGCFAWGNLHARYLGMNQMMRQYSPRHITALAGKSIRAISNGRCHTVALTDDGEVYNWGWDFYGEKSQASAQLVDGLEGINIIDVATGEDFSIALEDTGKVYIWGCIEKGLLGPQKKFATTSPIPLLMTSLEDKKIIAIAARNGIITALTDQCEAYGWNGKWNPLSVYLPENTKINAISVTVGARRILAKSENNEIFVFGTSCAICYPLEFPKINYDSWVLKFFKENNLQVASIVGGGDHLLALTNKGVYSWGSNEFGQLGLGDNTKQLNPQLIEALINEKVIAIAAGAEYSLALTDRMEVFGWGKNKYGELGLGDRINRSLPEKLIFPRQHRPAKKEAVVCSESSKESNRGCRMC